MQILPPLDEDPVATDYRLAREKSLLWRGLSDDERATVIKGELMLAERRRRTLPDWLEIGEVIDLLEGEVLRQANTGTTASPHYRNAWRQLAPDQIREMSQPNRSHAKWLWLNREAVQTWWSTVPPDRRDRWSHPLTIKIQYERAHKIAVIDPEREAEAEEQPRRHADSTRTRRAAAAAIDDSINRLDETADILQDTARDMAMITGRQPTSLTYDLSTQALAVESADNFWTVYHSQYGDASVQWFADALLAMLQRYAAQVAAAAAAPARQAGRRTTSEEGQ